MGLKCNLQTSFPALGQTSKTTGWFLSLQAINWHTLAPSQLETSGVGNYFSDVECILLILTGYDKMTSLSLLTQKTIMKLFQHLSILIARTLPLIPSP